MSKRNIIDPAPEIGHKEMFLITLVKTVINVFSRHIWQLLEQIWRSTLSHDVTMLHNCTLPYTFVAYTFANHRVLNQKKYSPDSWMEKLFPWTGNFWSSKLINVAIQKNNSGMVLFQSTFLSCRDDPFLEIDFIAAVEICWKFRNSFSTRACMCELFFATRKSSYTWTERDQFWRYLHLWRSFHESPMSGMQSIRLCKNITRNPRTGLN